MFRSSLGTFSPVSQETAIFYVGGVLAFVFAAFTALTAGAKGIPGRAVGFIALGLGLTLWPLMWNTVDAAF